jgi:hypothetical protein
VRRTHLSAPAVNPLRVEQEFLGFHAGRGRFQSATSVRNACRCVCARQWAAILICLGWRGVRDAQAFRIVCAHRKRAYELRREVGANSGNAGARPGATGLIFRRGV